MQIPGHLKCKILIFTLMLQFICLFTFIFFSIYVSYLLLFSIVLVLTAFLFSTTFWDDVKVDLGEYHIFFVVLLACRSGVDCKN
jgi:hypothetical protein